MLQEYTDAYWDITLQHRSKWQFQSSKHVAVSSLFLHGHTTRHDTIRYDTIRYDTAAHKIQRANLVVFLRNSLFLKSSSSLL